MKKTKRRSKSSPYRKGRKLEHRAKKELEEQGYLVGRSAGSKGPIDLFAFNHCGIRLIQVVKGSITSKKLKQLKKLPIPPHSTLEVWIAKRKGRAFFWQKQLIGSRKL